MICVFFGVRHEKFDSDYVASTNTIGKFPLP